MPTQHVPEAVVADDSPDIMGALLPEAGSAHGRQELRRARHEVSLAESSCHLELLACKDLPMTYDENTNLDEVIAEHAAAYTFCETQSMLLTQAEMLAVKTSASQLVITRVHVMDTGSWVWHKKETGTGTPRGIKDGCTQMMRVRPLYSKHTMTVG